MHNPEHEQIATRAYELWQLRGCADGGHEADWFQAEQELRVEPESALTGVAREVGSALGSVVTFISDLRSPMKKSRARRLTAAGRNLLGCSVFFTNFDAAFFIGLFLMVAAASQSGGPFYRPVRIEVSIHLEPSF